MPPSSPPVRTLSSVMPVSATCSWSQTRWVWRRPPAEAAAEWFFPADVRGMPDQRVLPPGPLGGLPGMTAEQVHAAAREYAASVGLTPGGRLNTSLQPDDLTGVLAAIAAPLVADAAVVYAGGEAEAATANA